jgi:hypothetical protein
MGTAHTRREHGSARRPLPVAKRARKKSSPVTGSKHGTVEDPKNEFTDEEWHDMVATAAYYWAESRGFQGSSPEDDWYEAEAELRQQLARAEKVLDATESPYTTDSDIERTGQ